MKGIPCRFCNHYLGKNKCRAFPDIIPELFFRSAEEHIVVQEGQIGSFVFDLDKIQFNDYVASLEILQESIRQSMESHNDLIQDLRSTMKTFIEKYPIAAKNIFDHGWFVDLDESGSFTFELNRLAGKGSSELDSYMTSYFTNQLGKIRDSLIAQYPNRKGIFNEAFEAHEGRKYYLSTIAFLTQIDGICNDSYGADYFRTKNKDGNKPNVTKMILEEGHGHLIEYFGIPFIEKNPLNVYKEDVYKFEVKLNRHEILHGKDVDYGSEVNSLKVLSLLNFLCVYFDKTKTTS